MSWRILLETLWSLIILWVGIFLGTCKTSASYRREAVEYGVAEYDKTTGDWHWIEPHWVKQLQEVSKP